MADIRQVIGPTILLFFLALVFIIAIIALYKYFSNRLAMRVVQDVLVANKDLSPEQIKALFNQSEHKNPDKRKGLIGLGLALACVLFGLTMGSGGYKLAQTSFFGMSLFPAILGLTYLYFHTKNR